MKRRGLADGTIYARMGELRRWLEFMGCGWRTANRHDVERWLDSRSHLSPRASYTAISHLSAFYRWAIREDLADHDPTMSVERPRLPMRLPRPVNHDAANDIVDQADDLRVAVLLMLDAGLRCCEVTRLRWDDVDLEAGTIYVFGKGSRERMQGMPRRLRMAMYLAAADLGDYRFSPEQYVIGRKVSPGRLSQLLAARFREIGHTGVTAHRLRHTYATRLYKATAGDLRAVQLALGHASVATTQIYAAVDADRVLMSARLLDDA